MREGSLDSHCCLLKPQHNYATAQGGEGRESTDRLTGCLVSSPPSRQQQCKGGRCSQHSLQTNGDFTAKRVHFAHSQKLQAIQFILSMLLHMFKTFSKFSPVASVGTLVQLLWILHFENVYNNSTTETVRLAKPLHWKKTSPQQAVGVYRVVRCWGPNIA
jgi:hypothetical protein